MSHRLTTLVLEGTHGAGKTTITHGLRSSVAMVIPSEIVPYKIVRMLPGDPRLAYVVNDVAKSEVRRLDPSGTAISDRWFTSTLAYVAFVAAAFPDRTYLAEAVTRISDGLASGRLLRPTVIVSIDVTGAEAWRRLARREGSLTWTSAAEVNFLASFHRDPPAWYRDTVRCELLHVESTTVAETTESVRSILESL